MIPPTRDLRLKTIKWRSNFEGQIGLLIDICVEKNGIYQEFHWDIMRGTHVFGRPFGRLVSCRSGKIKGVFKGSNCNKPPERCLSSSSQNLKLFSDSSKQQDLRRFLEEVKSLYEISGYCNSKVLSLLHICNWFKERIVYSGYVKFNLGSWRSHMKQCWRT